MARPEAFDDLKPGDSIAINGVCLTLESHDDQNLTFALAPETLKVTGWQPKPQDVVNLERSLKFGDRVHGHIVAGHVDAIGKVIGIQKDTDETYALTIDAPKDFLPFVWRKGSVAVHGVSLTINDVIGNKFKVGLIPETLKRTNLKNLKIGDTVHLEADAMARALYHWRITQ